MKFCRHRSLVVLLTLFAFFAAQSMLLAHASGCSGKNLVIPPLLAQEAAANEHHCHGHGPAVPVDSICVQHCNSGAAEQAKDHLYSVPAGLFSKDAIHRIEDAATLTLMPQNCAGPRSASNDSRPSLQILHCSLLI